MPASGPVTWTSPRFGYMWTLSPEWEFYPVEEIGIGPKTLIIDVVAARPKGQRRPSALLYVFDYTFSEPTRDWGSEPTDYERLEESGRGVLDSHDIEHVGTRRIELFGQQGVEVAGMLEDEGLSIRMTRRDRRHFEVRCLGAHDEPEWPCESAFKAFTISEPPARPVPAGPRVLHLREPRFGLEFDAPDESWLATGPHTGGGGAQLVWMWRKADQEIDVQAMDLRNLPTEPTEELFLDRYTEVFEREAGQVVVGKALLGGEPCHQLKLKRADGWHKDMFFLHRNGIHYSMLITQRRYDPKLIARATKALRLTPLPEARERRQAWLLTGQN